MFEQRHLDVHACSFLQETAIHSCVTVKCINESMHKYKGEGGITPCHVVHKQPLLIILNRLIVIINSSNNSDHNPKRVCKDA